MPERFGAMKNSSDVVGTVSGLRLKREMILHDVYKRILFGQIVVKLGGDNGLEHI